MYTSLLYALRSPLRQASERGLESNIFELPPRGAIQVLKYTGGALSALLNCCFFLYVLWQEFIQSVERYYDLI